MSESRGHFHRASDSVVESVTEKQGKRQGSEFLSLKGEAGEDSCGDADPQARNCNLATHGFLV